MMAAVGTCTALYEPCIYKPSLSLIICHESSLISEPDRKSIFQYDRREELFIGVAHSKCSVFSFLFVPVWKM